MEDLTISRLDGTPKILSGVELQQLINSTHAEILTPRDPTYDEVRKVWNGMINRKPSIIVRCRDAADVATCVNFAREHELRVSIRGGGHNVAGNAVNDGGLVIDLSNMRGVSVDSTKGTVKVEGGATNGDVDKATQALALATPLGLVSATGVSGLSLHGGMGWLLRKHGLSSDNLVSAEVVTADGRLLTASTEENSDLFWALKGGGGNFGVVTSFEFKVHPVGPKVWFAVPMYSIDDSVEVAKSFRKFVAEAPDELSAIGVFWSAPEAPGVPEELHGKPVFITAACYTGPFDRGEQAIEPLRKFAEPVADLSGPAEFLDVQKSFDPEYPNGRRYYWKSTFIQELTDDVIETLAAVARRRPSPISSVDIWALGGAFSRASNTAFSNRDSPFLIALEANWDNPEHDQENIAWARQGLEDISRFSTARAYLNFPGFAEEGEDLVKGAFGGNYQRLQAIKATYDPGNLFRSHLNIRPTALA